MANRPDTLAYGAFAVAEDGTLYAGNNTNAAVEQAKQATLAQEITARTADTATCLRSSAQTLTAEQQTRARTNIGAASTSALTALSQRLTNISNAKYWPYKTTGTDLLGVDLGNNEGSANAPYLFGVSNASTDLVNSPYTAALPFYGYRLVYANTTTGHTGTLTMVDVHELYPVSGRVWCNTYDVVGADWRGWKEYPDKSQMLPLTGGTVNGNLTVAPEYGISSNNYSASDSTSTLRVVSTSYINFQTGVAVQARNKADSAWIAVNALSFNQQSSRKYKKNIEDMTVDEAKKLLSLRPVSFDYINEQDGTGCLGLIAEEVENVEKYPCAYGPDGTVEGLDYSRFVPQLIKMVQMLDSRVKQLEDKLSANNI